MSALPGSGGGILPPPGSGSGGAFVGPLPEMTVQDYLNALQNLENAGLLPPNPNTIIGQGNPDFDPATGLYYAVLSPFVYAQVLLQGGIDYVQGRPAFSGVPTRVQLAFIPPAWQTTWLPGPAPGFTGPPAPIPGARPNNVNLGDGNDRGGVIPAGGVDDGKDDNRRMPPADDSRPDDTPKMPPPVP